MLRTTGGTPHDEVALDRDVVLTARGVDEGAAPTRSLVAHRAPGSDGYFALGSVPDLWSLGAEASRRACVVFLVDVSGSMAGDSIREARAALKLCLRHLRAGDVFNIIAFSSGHTSFAKGPTEFSQQRLDAADRWVDALHADGGTELMAPLLEAVKSAPGGLVVLLTDGQVGNEDEILRATLQARGERGARVCSFGIGTHVSDALLRDLARDTGGAVEFIHPGERIDEKVVAQFSRAVAPRIADVTVRFTGVDVGEAAPARAPDVVDGVPWSIFARYAAAGAGHAELTGTYDGKPFTLRLAPAAAMELLETGQARVAPPPPHGKGRADDLGTLFARQLASGLWDDISLGPASARRTHQATLAVLRRLLAEGVDTSHPLYGAPLKKALEALAVLTLADVGLAERLLGLSLLLASGPRTRTLLLVAVRRAGLHRLTGELADPDALRAWALALP